MTRLKATWLLAMIVALPAPAAHAQPAIGDPGFDIFRTVCVVHQGDPAKAAAALQTAGYTVASAEFAAHFRSFGSPGPLWVAPAPAQIVVKMEPDNVTCQVGVRGGDTVREAVLFDHAFEGAAKAGLSVTKPVDRREGPVHTVVYRVTSATPGQSAASRFFSISLNPSPDAALSTMMVVTVQNGP